MSCAIEQTSIMNKAAENEVIAERISSNPLDTAQERKETVEVPNQPRVFSYHPVLGPMDASAPLGNQIGIALDHPWDLFTLSRVHKENDLIMPHSVLLSGNCRLLMQYSKELMEFRDAKSNQSSR